MMQLLFSHVPKIVHEGIGILLLAAVLFHLYGKRGWWTALRKGRYSAYRLLMTTINLVLLVLFAATMVLGVLISDEVFAGIVPLEVRKTLFLHELHKGLPWYMLLVLSVHVGLHLPFHRSSRRTRSLLFLIAMSGMLLGSTEHMLPERLAFEHIFGTPAQMAGFPAALISLAGIAFFGVFVGGILRLRLVKR